MHREESLLDRLLKVYRREKNLLLPPSGAIAREDRQPPIDKEKAMRDYTNLLFVDHLTKYCVHNAQIPSNAAPRCGIIR